MCCFGCRILPGIPVETWIESGNSGWTVGIRVGFQVECVQLRRRSRRRAYAKMKIVLSPRLKQKKCHLMELAVLKLQLQRRTDVPAAWQISPERSYSFRKRPVYTQRCRAPKSHLIPCTIRLLTESCPTACPSNDFRYLLSHTCTNPPKQ